MAETKMILTLSPMRRETPLRLERRGMVLMANGTALDFSALKGRGPWPAETVPGGETWLTGELRRRRGALHLTVILPHGAQAPQETLFPAPLTLAGDGVVPLPAYEIPIETIAEE